MSEVDVAGVTSLYHHPTLGDIAISVIDDLAQSQGQPDAYMFAHAIAVITRRANGVVPARMAVVQFFQQLENFGVGIILAGDHIQSSFKWKCSPIRLARVVTGELETL
jgi:hypothetical protein